MENRCFHRVTLNTSGALTHHDLTYNIRLENLSLRGALLSSDECLMIPAGETCAVSLSLCDGTEPIPLTAEVVHSFFSMIGIKFVAFANGDERRIYEFLKGITPEPEKLAKEWTETLGQPILSEEGVIQH